MKRKRVLFVTKSDVSIGGTEKHLTDLILSLDCSKVEPVILCYGQDPYSEALKERHCLPIEILHGANPANFASVWRAFVRIRPQIIVFVNGQLGEFHWCAYLAARLSGVSRAVAIEHLIADLPAHLRPENPASRRSILRRAFDQARLLTTSRMGGLLCSATICVSDAVRERLVKHYKYPERKTITIRNGVDLRTFGVGRNTENGIRQKLSISPSDTVILCLTRFVPQKRVDVLLQAMSRIVPEHPSCTCIIVGTGQLETKLRALSEELGLGTRVRFVGHADDVRPYLEAGDILVLPSQKEGLPLTLLEAMAASLPCIATDAGGNKEAVLHDHSGLIVPPGCAEELAEAIKYLIVHPAERMRMARNARQRAIEFFDIENSMAKVRAVILGLNAKVVSQPGRIDMEPVG
jgi:glycosyltransferase involved in cell wall biosynthesis